MYILISIERQNKVLSSKIEKCCEEHESIVICTYASEVIWILCNLHDQDEAFQNFRTSRMRIKQ